jgi:acyl carrier protein
MKELRLEQLVEILGEVVDLSGARTDEGAVLGEDIQVDSREMLRVISRIEALCGSRFAPQDLLTIKTLGSLLEATRRLSSASRRS